jgi:hypothetical protein
LSPRVSAAGAAFALALIRHKTVAATVKDTRPPGCRC